MAVPPVPTQAKVAMAAVSGLILLKIALFKTFIRTTSRLDAVVAIREFLVTPPVLAIALAVFAWACWVTWRLGKADNDVRLLLQVLLGLDAFLLLLLMSVEYLPDWRL
jgi:hypothetical protein